MRPWGAHSVTRSGGDPGGGGDGRVGKSGDRTVDGSTPTAGNFALRNLGNSVNPSLPVSFG